jgi:clan AA aspartic protease (TIGR02281 family)
MYSYFYLGQKDEALKLMKKMLETQSKGNYYEAACLYSLMNEKEKSLECLRKSLEGGYYRFDHIRRDKDLDNIHKTPEFEALMKEFEDLLKKEIGAEGTEQEEYEEEVSEVPFTKNGGVYKVKCEINDLPLHFVFDTGASDVSISNVEATFMLKNNYLKPSDIIGKQNYMNANGEIIEGTVINLRKVGFAGMSLTNVRASVVRNQVAPLLLGQSVLARLGKIEIDNDKKMLKVTMRKKK